MRCLQPSLYFDPNPWDRLKSWPPLRDHQCLSFIDLLLSEVMYSPRHGCAAFLAVQAMAYNRLWIESWFPAVQGQALKMYHQFLPDLCIPRKNMHSPSRLCCWWSCGHMQPAGLSVGWCNLHFLLKGTKNNGNRIRPLIFKVWFCYHYWCLALYSPGNPVEIKGIITE